MPAALSILIFIPKEILGFLYWWYFLVPVQFILYILRLLKVFLDVLAVPVMIRTLFTPMFHDYTITGRALSFVFRIFRILFGLFINFLLSSILVVFFFTWLSLPIIISLGLFYSFRGLL